MKWMKVKMSLRMSLRFFHNSGRFFITRDCVDKINNLVYIIRDDAN